MTTNIRGFCLLSVGLLLAPTLVRAQMAEAAGQDREPALRIEAGGPTAYVTSLVFGANDKSLYAAGFDKLVHAWNLDRDGKFVVGRDAYRVPLGPGVTGSINSIAQSSDGVWLAVASRGVVRGTASFRQLGIYVPSVAVMSPEMWEDQGAIIVYNTRTGDARELRGHRGRVASLAFAPSRVGSPPILASVAREFQEKEFVGAVRLWDVANGKEIAHLIDLPDLALAGRPLWPHLALWSKGDVIRVALAWEDGKFRLWDVKDGKGRLTTEKDGDFNNTVAALPEKDQVLTGSVRDGKGLLTLWDLSGAKPVARVQVPLLVGQRPRSIALFPAQPGGAVNRAAVVVDSPVEGSKDIDYLVRFVDLTELKPVRSSLVLWTGAAMAPTIAASPNGRFLAAAGNKDHEVNVFALADLLANQDKKQVLRGLGSLIQSAAFVKKGQDVGLYLNETAVEGREKGQPPAAPRRGDLIFDFANRNLTEGNGWQLDSPDLTGWDVKPSTLRDDKKRIKEHILQVSHNGEAVGTVHLKPSEFIDEFALLPGTNKRPPLLAVAIVELNQPMLRLYDARTGEHIRQLTGHVNRIHSLAFSSNGKLLVSAAEDQTTCVWGLSNLDQFLGLKGMIHGLIVSERNKELVLAPIDEAAVGPDNFKKLSAAKVQEGDVIEGLVIKDKLQPTTTVPDFYDSVVVFAPGKSVTLRIAKRGDVTLRVGQATDGHRPLLTLFVTRPGKGGVRHWVGWNPVGPYDFSDRDAESLLGWQQNTGDPKQPALFAEAREYRTVHYKPDILRYLVERGDTGRAIEAWKIDHPEKVREPSLTLWIKELGPDAKPDAAGRLLLEQPQITLQLTINELAAEQIRSVSWQRDGDRGELTHTPDGDWSADLSRLAWKRGDHKVRVILKTTGDGQEYPRELVLRYQPPRPTVAVVGALPRLVEKEEYVLEARIVPAAGQEAELNVTQQHDGKEVRKDTRKVTKTETVKEKFTLREGRNQLKLLARNQGATGEGESDVLSVEVLYQPKKAPPQISITAAAPVPDGPVLRPDPASLDREPLVVDTPTVVIVGSVEALKPLTAVSFSTDEKGAREQPIALDPGKPLQLALSQKVALAAPGQTRKVIFYATADGVRVERSLSVRYEPRLPELRITSPVEGQPLIEGKDGLDIRVEGRMIWLDERNSCTVQVIVNDKEQNQPSKLTGESSALTLAAKLQPGENYIQVRLKNEWHEATTPKLLVNYRRPPKVVSFTAPAKSVKPFVDAVVLVESPKTLPLTTLRVQGHDLPAERLAPAVEQQKGDVTVWRINLKEMPLQKGKNVLTFQAGNQDGWALKAAETTVISEDPVQPKATVELLSPLQDAVVDVAEFPVQYRIRSSSPLKKVEVQRNGVIVFQKEKADLAAVTKNAGGEYELSGTQKVALQSGTNSLKVVAQNDGGEQESRAVVLTSQAGPATIYVTHLDAGKELASLGFDGSRVLFPKAEQAKVVVKGHITWGAASDSQVGKVNQVRIYVNGCQQPPAVLEKQVGDRRERTFKAEVQLTRAKENYITVKLPDLAEDRGSRNHCLVDCAQPDLAVAPRRQAHLLIVDTGKEGEKAIVERVLQSLHAASAGENRFSKDGFADGGRIYGPLVGAEVAPERVYKQLVSIKRNLKLRAAAGASNDVVFVYFHGGEALDAQGHFLRTADADRDPELRWSGLPRENLTRYCADNLGAQLVLLDVTRETRGGNGQAQDKVLQWPDDPSVAVFRYAWNGAPQAEPASARLVNDLTAAMSSARELRDVAKFLRGKFVENRELKPVPSLQFKEQLTLSEQVPPGLEDIILSGR